MSDLISRQAAIDAMESINDGICEQQAIDALCELPSEQPEIIRCKDCVKRHHGCRLQVWCGPDDNDYCSYGEREE